MLSGSTNISWLPRRALPLAGLLALLMVSSALNIYTVKRDTLPVVADASGYYRTSLAWYRLLQDGRLDELMRRTVRPNVRPPLPQLVTMGVFGLTGDTSQAMARLSILPFFWVLLISTYAIGAKLKDRPTGLVAATLLACFPQVLGYSRIYWMDLPLAAMTALSIYSLLTSRGFSRRWSSVVFGLTVGLGLLTKYTFPVFILGPLVVALLSCRRQVLAAGVARRRRLVQALENLSLALLAATALCGAWYANTFSAAWNNFIFNQGVGVLRPRQWWTLSNLVLYLKHLSTQLGPLNLVALIVTLPLLRHARPGTARLLLGWFILPYLFFTYLVLGMEWSRFTLPYLPALALVIAVGLMQFRFQPLARGAAIASCTLALLGAARLAVAAAPETPAGTFSWRRIRTTGMLTPQSYDLHLEIEAAFPPLARARAWRHVAVFPDAGNMASVLETWALQQRARVLFSVPHEPEGRDFGGFRFPARVADPAYLMQHHYVVRMVPPPRTRTIVRRQDIYQRFLRLWQAQQHRFELVDERRLPNGYRLLIHRRRDGVPGPLERKR